MIEALSLWRGVIRRRETMKEVATEVAASHGLTLEDLRAPRLSASVLAVRNAAVREVRQRTGRSWLAIGRCFHRHHTTVLIVGSEGDR